eukprot:g2406.t1
MFSLCVSVAVVFVGCVATLMSVLHRCLAIPAMYKKRTISKEEYQIEKRKVQRVMESVDVRKGVTISLSQKGNVSTIFAQSKSRSKSSCAKLDLSAFEGVVSFDRKAQIVTVGGKTSFKALTEFLLPLGFMPRVVPELDTITVGGALSGVGIESSSFRYGFVHNSLISFEILLSNGSVIRASENEHEDLFRGFAHSYGTLGYILRATLSVVPAESDVVVHVRRFRSLSNSVEYIRRIIRNSADGQRKHSESKGGEENCNVDFLEGVAFDLNDIVILTARFASKVPMSSSEIDRTVRLPRDGRFVDILESARAPSFTFKMSTYDYLWRWDADMFWGTKHIAFLGWPWVRKWLGRRFLRARVLWRLVKDASLSSFVAKVRAVLSASCNFWQMQTKRATSKTTTVEHVIQDLGVPMQHAEAFLERVVRGKHAQLPFWLCPARFEDLAHQATLFPPPPGQQSTRGGWILDIASFGSVPRSKTAPNEKYFHNRKIDAILDEFGGAKTFYSDVLYTREYIHKHFNGDNYERLKRAYDPSGRFPHLHDKVINKD